MIPPNQLNQAAIIMLNKYTPLPNTMNMGGMTMMGQPTVIGAGNDANNYLDATKEHVTDDQETNGVKTGHKSELCFSPAHSGRRGHLPGKFCQVLAG